MLRLVAIVLLLANGLYFAWTQGLLAGIGLAPVQQREPERLQGQVKPDTLRLLNGPRESAQTAAPAGGPSVAEPAVPVQPPATACWEAPGFTPVQAELLRTALVGSGMAEDLWQLNEVRSAGRWVVYMGRYNEEQMTRKKAELRELKIEFREVNLPTAGPGLALGTFSSEEAVQQALKDVAKKGVRTARAALERPETVSMTLRLSAITEAQRASIEALGTPLAGKALQRCD